MFVRFSPSPDAVVARVLALLVEHPGPSGPFSTSLPGDNALLVTRFLGNLSAYIGYPVPGEQRLLTIDCVLITANTLTTDSTISLFKDGGAVPRRHDDDQRAQPRRRRVPNHARSTALVRGQHTLRRARREHRRRRGPHALAQLRVRMEPDVGLKE